MDGYNARVVHCQCCTACECGALASWDIVIVDEVRDWLRQLRKEDRETVRLIAAAIDVLESQGPALGRPLVDTVHGSELRHLKELRPGSSGSSEVRILFAFDPARRGVLLVAGDKSGNWRGWYEQAIPLAEERYSAHLKSHGQE
ncbi:type II toxin-antitoxin system RelE/ParE family toxin [Streptomyces hayashii]|uniref:type II toxin-antitoxin system RelE/ParE family toxin n=1 Tax=Streptomyces hayashii TaxID=2839966 RepID=UPI00403CB338